MAYFHFSSFEHAIGTVLKPGHWGATLDKSHYWEPSPGQQFSIDAFHEPWRLASEAMLETIRASEFSSRPSRFNCVFVLDGMSTVELCRPHLGGNPHLYEIELVDPAANTFVADFNLLRWTSRFAPRVPFFPNTREIARRYWSGVDPMVPETLTSSDVILRRRIE
ncbi:MULTISPECIES: DUF2441 domain-containing protein [Burkholderia]|uniref:DUF2441 domain-containing protein n=1 Tax=Burkholderia TaxID=32008 RepID=UPI001FC89859|nr:MULTISPECIES: DUF2441 domain-containing protein [Burkholderia]